MHSRCFHIPWTYTVLAQNNSVAIGTTGNLMSKKEKITDKQEENEIEFDGAVEEKLKLLRQFHLNCSHN
jgi:hypothetical protein